MTKPRTMPIALQEQTDFVAVPNDELAVNTNTEIRDSTNTDDSPYAKSKSRFIHFLIKRMRFFHYWLLKFWK